MGIEDHSINYIAVFGTLPSQNVDAKSNLAAEVK